MRALFLLIAVAALASCASASSPRLVATGAAPRTAPEGSDYLHLSNGEDVPELDSHAAAGKVTVFDFYAEWCIPCRQVDTYVYGLLAERSDVAYRKINVVHWETPVAKRYLAESATLPYVVVYGRDQKRVREIRGSDMKAIRLAIAEAAAK